MSKNPNWKRSEQMLALELYCRTPFGKIHSRNPEIIELSERIGRTPGAIALKMSNFAALDPTIDRKGMGNYSRSDAKIWEEFFDNPPMFLDRVSELSTFHLPEQDEYEEVSQRSELLEGEDVLVIAKSRRYQGFFRKALLAAYGGRCALTDISHSELLVASHIKPWAADKNTRLNPRNGILLNSLHDRAFDRGLITFDDDLTMIASKKLDIPEMAVPFFMEKEIRQPEKFRPNPAFLKYHRTQVFQN